MAAKLEPLKFRWTKDDGTPAAGWQVFNYIAGTSTKKDTYTDTSKSSTNANPVILDSRGEADIFFEGSYKVVIGNADETDPPTSPQETMDNFGTADVSTQNTNNLIPNGSFETDADGDTIPDGWTLTPATGGTIARSTADQDHGQYSLLFTAGSSGSGTAVSTAFIPVSPAEELEFRFDLKSNAITDSNDVKITWYTSAQNSVSTTTVYSSATANPTAWERKTFFLIPPATGVFAKITFDLAKTTADITNVDNVVLVPTSLKRVGHNAIINGDFDHWQRGVSFASATVNAYGTDRFLFGGSFSAGVVTYRQSTDIPTQAQSGHRSNYSLHIDVTTADASIAVGDLYAISQRIEGYNYKDFEGNVGTLSFWVKGTKTGIHCVSFSNSGSDLSYVVEYTINTASTWEKKVITVTFDNQSGTWDRINGIGLQVSWTLASGSNFHGTADTWNSANDYATSNQVNAMDNAANDFRLSQVQFELGSVATDFEYRDQATELAMCKRYYERLTGTANASVAVGTAISTTIARCFMPYLHKRVAPTITFAAVDDLSIRDTAGSTTSTALSTTAAGLEGAQISVTVASGLTGDQATTILFVDSSSYIEILAEL